MFEGSWIIAELMNGLACRMLPRMIRQTASLSVNMARQLLLGSERQAIDAPMHPMPKYDKLLASSEADILKRTTTPWLFSRLQPSQA